MTKAELGELMKATPQFKALKEARLAETATPEWEASMVARMYLEATPEHKAWREAQDD